MNRRYKTVNFLACVYNHSRPGVFLKALPSDSSEGTGWLYTQAKKFHIISKTAFYTQSVAGCTNTLVYSLTAVFQREKWPSGFWINIIYRQPPYVKTNVLHNAFLGS